MSNPRFGQTFPANLILFEKTTSSYSVHYIGARLDTGSSPCSHWKPNAAFLKVGHLATCVPSASLTIRFPHSVTLETHNFVKHLLKMQTFFSQISIPENPSEVPQVGDGISGPASRFEAPRHNCSWHAPWHLLRAKALQPRRGRCAPHRGAACHLRWFPGPRQRRCQQPRTTKVVGMLSSTRSTDKRTMNILDL